MKRTQTTSGFAITAALIGLVWMVAVAAFNMIAGLDWECWASMLCVLVALMAAELYLLVIRKSPHKQAEESGALGLIFTACYLIISFLLNGIFVLLKTTDYNWILFALNLAELVGYVILLFWAEQHTQRLTGQLEKVESKTSATAEVGRKLGELLAVTNDPEIRAKLVELKQTVDYSSNITTDAVAYREQQMIQQLDEILQLSLGNADRMILLSKVDMADKTWKMRNSVVSGNR